MSTRESWFNWTHLYLLSSYMPSRWTNDTCCRLAYVIAFTCWMFSLFAGAFSNFVHWSFITFHLGHLMLMCQLLLLSG